MKRSPLVDRLTIAMFVAMLAAPLAASVVGVGKSHEAVRFELESDRPQWSWAPKKLARFPIDFQRYYNTHFRFRDQLTALHARLKVDVFGVTSSDRVTLGKDGWLFYAGEDTVADYQRIRPFTPAELAQWTRVLVGRRDWLRARGIPYLFVVAPNPQSIYPEHMPDSLPRAKRPSRMQQLLAYLRTHSDLDIVDLEQSLLDAKPHELVVYKTDTHWNQLGGFVAYEQIARWLAQKFPQVKPLTRADLERVEVPRWSGALGYFLNLPASYTETRVELHARDGAKLTTDGAPLPHDETRDSWFRRREVVRTSDVGEIERAVIIRDSQFSAPGQFLTRHFRHSLLVWRRHMEAEIIEREKPNVVIQEMAERLLMVPVAEDEL